MKTVTLRIDVPWSSTFAGSTVSLVLHVVVLLAVSTIFRGCQRASSGDAGGEPFRDVGLFIVDGVDGGLADAGKTVGAGDADVTVQAEQNPGDDSSDDAAEPDNTPERVPTEAPEIGTLLNLTGNDAANDSPFLGSTLPPFIGPGVPIGGRQRPKTGGGGSLNTPSEAGGAARVGGKGGPGTTTFMDIAGVGKTVVYVIDTSSSMHGNRLKIAQGQLKASLRLLHPNQKFAVIFYNEYRERLTLRRQAEQDMYFATDFNKEQAAAEVNRLISDHGTDHKPAILEALSLQPDVLYFLTDGDEPSLSAGDLAEIRRVSGSTTIHVIKFGDGTMSSRATSWLELLARQGSGEFREIVAGN